MKRRLFALVLTLSLLLAPMGALAASPALPLSEEAMAQSLKGLGLFQGVSDCDFALDRAPTRAEALVMLLRLLGKEQAVKTCTSSHPFTDTAGHRWADPYIAYAYAQGLTKGQSATAFGGAAAADVRSYLTFVLRALGYTEGADGDFLWSDPIHLAMEIGVLPLRVNLTSFRRADVVTISYAALDARCKGSDVTLAQTLVDAGVLEQAALDAWYDAGALRSGGFSQPLAGKLQNAMDTMTEARLAAGITLNGTPANYGSVIQVGDAAYENYGFYAQGAADCARQIRQAAEALGDKANVYGIVVPNALGAVLSYADFSRLCSSTKNETEAIAYAYEQMGDQVRTPDAIRQLRLHNDEYIYFRTDHHWTALGAYYAYVAWAESAGLTPVSLDRFSKLEMPNHLGLFYSMCGNPQSMRQNPDTVVAYIPPDIDSIHVEFLESGGVKKTGQLVYDYTNSGYKYGAFIGGDHPLTTITNDRIQDDSACVLVKDSYGNPFSVYLTQHYHTVYVIDYRYYRNISGYLTFSRFAAERGVTDFIVLLPMTLSQSAATANYLASYCK